MWVLACSPGPPPNVPLYMVPMCVLVGASLSEPHIYCVQAWSYRHPVKLMPCKFELHQSYLLWPYVWLQFSLNEYNYNHFLSLSRTPLVLYFYCQSCYPVGVWWALLKCSVIACYCCFEAVVVLWRCVAEQYVASLHTSLCIELTTCCAELCFRLYLESNRSWQTSIPGEGSFYRWQSERYPQWQHPFCACMLFLDSIGHTILWRYGG